MAHRVSSGGRSRLGHGRERHRLSAGDLSSLLPKLFPLVAVGTLGSVLVPQTALVGLDPVEGAVELASLAATGSQPSDAVAHAVDAAGALGSLRVTGAGAVALDALQGYAVAGEVAGLSSGTASVVSVLGAGSVASLGATGGAGAWLSALLGGASVSGVSVPMVSVTVPLPAQSAAGSLGALKATGTGKGLATAVSASSALGALKVGTGAVGRASAVAGASALGGVIGVGEMERLEAMLPAPEVGKIVAWNASGTALVNVDISTFLDSIASTATPTGGSAPRYWIDRSGV